MSQKIYCFVAAIGLTVLPATLASADWFTQIMTIEGGRDAVFAAQWRAQMRCATCRGQRCRHRSNVDVLQQESAPEPLIVPRSRFVPLPTRPAFEPQVPWVAREIVLDPLPTVDHGGKDFDPPPDISAPPPMQVAPEKLPVPETPAVPLKPPAAGWQPARPRG